MICLNLYRLNYFSSVFMVIFFGLSLAISKKSYNSHFDLTPIPIYRKIIWRAKIDWFNPNNWLPLRRLPCANDRIVLPESYVLFLNHHLETTELVLPENGELIFGPNGAIKLVTENEPEDLENPCKDGTIGSTLEFHPEGPNSWFSPDHWQLMCQIPNEGDFISPMIPDTWPISNFATFMSSNSWKQSSIPIIPHSERIPCTGDWVHFPTNNGSFKVTIEQSSQVAQLSFLSVGSARFMQSSQFDDLLKSFRGRMLFDVRDFNHLQLAPYGTVGVCGNDAPKRLKIICGLIQNKCAHLDSLPCSDPITPAGYCCPICASSLIMRSKILGPNNLMKVTLLRHMQKVHKENQIQLVRIYAHYLYDGALQVVADTLPDQGKPINDKYIRTLLSNLNQDPITWRMKIEIKSSNEWIEDSNLLSGFIWFFFILFVLSILFYPVYVYYQRTRTDPAFTFVRFRSQGDIEFELDPSVNLNFRSNVTSVGVNEAPMNDVPINSFPFQYRRPFQRLRDMASNIFRFSRQESINRNLSANFSGTSQLSNLTIDPLDHMPEQL